VAAGKIRRGKFICSYKGRLLEGAEEIEKVKRKHGLEDMSYIFEFRKNRKKYA